MNPTNRISRAEIAKQLGVQTQRIAKWERTGRFPPPKEYLSGRVIFYDSDLDGLYARLIAAGCRPDTAPCDAVWGERFFHLTDPDGHELSFAWPLASSRRQPSS